MKPKASQVIINLLIIIGLPFLLNHFNFFNKLDSKQIIPYLLGFGMILVSLLNWFFQYNIGKLKNEISEHKKLNLTNSTQIQSSLDNLKNDIKGISENIIYSLDRDDIYKYMKSSITKAEKKVNLMYFGSKPPKAYLSAKNKTEYIDSLDKIIKDKNKTVIRIILLTKANKKWIKSIVDKYEGNETFSLYVLSNQANLPLISVQVIDNRKAILMNFDKSIDTDFGRDLVIKSEKFMNIFSTYYGAVINKSHKILLNGKKDATNYNKKLK